MLRTVLAILLCLPLYLHATDAPRVLVTIKPVHSLVSTLLEGIAEADLLLTGIQSPHNHQLKPSEAMRLYSADVIVWVGPTLESFLPRYLRNFRDKTIVTLLDDDQHAADHLHIDPHRWLDPLLAIEDSKAIAYHLSKRYPAYAPLIRVNLARLINRLHLLDQQLTSLLTPNTEISALLYHDAWGYFIRRYQLRVHGIINPQPHSQPGVRHLEQVHDTAQSKATKCILAEPQFKPRYLDKLAQNPATEVKIIDPLGASEPSGTEAYFNMMHANASVFAQCR